MIKSLKIISGGQTGVDRAALDFALENKIDCYGWCPKGRRAEDGPIPLSYPLRETKESRYRERTIKNVEESQGLLVFVDNKPDKGTILAIDQAEKRNIPTYIIHLAMNVEDQETGVLNLLENSNISVINIVGPRESNSPGIYNKTKAFLEKLFFRLEGAGSSK
ncbi:MAG TPA: molybdenum cofactor carrier [Bacteroidetes bacterium]|nr:molybdenum cofactor carrier [Bacteroidota bacterium]